MSKRRVTLAAAALSVALLLGVPLVNTAVATVTQYHNPTVQGCTVRHYTLGWDGGGNAYAFSSSDDINSCVTYNSARTQWCKNYYCEHDGWNADYWTTVFALKYATGHQTVDLVRGWSLHCVDAFPHYYCKYDESGDLIP